MSVRITRTFYDGFTLTSGGGATNMPGNVCDVIRCDIDVAFYWNIESTRVVCDSAADTVELVNTYDRRTFLTQGFKVGDNIHLNAALNKIDTTITAISDDGRTITVADALIDETVEGADVFGTTPITSIDLYYNLIANSSAESYTSAVDPTSMQRFSATGLDATDTVTTTDMHVSTASLAWVTQTGVDADTFETAQVQIVGMGVVDREQLFRITTYFVVAPIWQLSLYSNLTQELAPDYFSAGSSLKHICRVDGWYEEAEGDADHSASATSAIGVGGWFDQGIKGAAPEYRVTDISYSGGLTKLEVNTTTTITITLTSRRGKFVTGAGTTGTRIVVGFYACPNDETRFQRTESTMLQNLCFDTATVHVGGASANGTGFGTGYQVLTTTSAVRVNAETVTITTTFQAGGNLVDLWEAAEDNDRNYVLFVSTQDRSTTTTRGVDRVTCLADFQSADFDKTDDGLFNLTGTGIMAFEYPDNGIYGVGSVNGFAGDPWLARCGFSVDSESTIRSVKWQVLAEKTDCDDFILEEKIIDTSAMRRVAGVQQLSYDQSRGFISYDDDPRNAVTLERDADEDGGGFYAYQTSYGFVLRYEDWIDALIQPGDRVNGETPQVALDIENVTQKWSNYSGVDGWGLKLRLTVVVRGTNDFDNEYYTEVPVTVIGDADVEWDGGTGALTQALEYFVYEPDGGGINGGYAGEELAAIDRDGLTLVRYTCEGDFVLPAEASDWYGWLFANTPTGTIFDRRFASTEYVSEDNSPWSDPGEDLDADSSRCDGNIRINVYNGVRIVIEGVFSAAAYSKDEENLVIYPRLGAKYIAT